MLLLLVLPLLGLLGRSTPAALWQALGSDEVGQALWVTMLTSGTALLGIIIGGTPVALWLARQPRQAWTTMVVDLPGVLPPAVAGLALLSMFGRTGWLGGSLSAWGITVPFTPVAVVLAQMFVAGPLYIRSVSVALAAIDDEIIAAAQLDGADTRALWQHVIVPLAWPGFQAGTAIALARSLGEFGATALFAGSLPGSTRTMALAIYVAAESNDAAAITMSLILLGISLLILWFVRRRDV
jgi:molybdate transport system permease protein